MENSHIGWTDHTFNPWIGCTKVNEGCTNCYAEADQDQFRGRVVWGPGGTRSRTSIEYWKKPLRWNRDAATAWEVRRVFCASLADVFEDWTGPVHGKRADKREVDYSMPSIRTELFAMIDSTPNLIWILLTKRPENVRDMWPADGELRSNVWLGTSVSDQKTLDRYFPLIANAGSSFAAVTFLSVEPLLGPVDFGGRLRGGRIGWVIVGGESGPKRRVCDVGIYESIVQQCGAADVPCFVKQDGGAKPGQQGRIPDAVWAYKEFPHTSARVA